MRRQAFKAIREEIGDEICPTVRLVKENVSIKDRDLLDECCTTTHHLRGALAAFLVLFTRLGDGPCPNCQRPMDDHNPKCIVERLMLRMKAERRRRS